MIERRKVGRPPKHTNIYCIELQKRYDDISEASHDIGVHRSNVYRVLTGAQRKTKGCTFVYLK